MNNDCCRPESDTFDFQSQKRVTLMWWNVIQGFLHSSRLLSFSASTLSAYPIPLPGCLSPSYLPCLSPRSNPFLICAIHILPVAIKTTFSAITCYLPQPITNNLVLIKKKQPSFISLAGKQLMFCFLGKPGS